MLSDDEYWDGPAMDGIGSAYVVSTNPDPEQPAREFVLQRGLWVPKGYEPSKRPIGFVWA